jgi:hypothetical protein
VSKYTAAQAEGARRDLLEYIRPGDEISVKTMTVAKSGASRTVIVLAVRKGRIWDITHLVGRTLGYPVDRSKHTLRLNGGGTDMHYHLVDGLSRALFPGVEISTHPRLYKVTL